MDPVSIDRRGADRSESTARRTRPHLRDLCDEVLASYRAAHGSDAVSAEDRATAESMLGGVGPRRAR